MKRLSKPMDDVTERILKKSTKATELLFKSLMKEGPETYFGHLGGASIFALFYECVARPHDYPDAFKGEVYAEVAKRLTEWEENKANEAA